MTYLAGLVSIVVGFHLALEQSHNSHQTTLALLLAMIGYGAVLLKRHGVKR